MNHIPPFEDTINWDPDSDSVFFNAMNEENLPNEHLYHQLEHHEQVSTIALGPKQGIPHIYVRLHIGSN